MAEIILLCGKVAAGKTTYAKALAKQQRAVILSIDDLIVTLRDHCEGPTVLRDQEGAIRAYFCTLGEQLLAQGISCIIDHGHWTRDARRQVIDYCEQRGLAYRIVLLECPWEIRRQRLLARNAALKKSNERAYVIDEAQCLRFDTWFEALSEEEAAHAQRIESEGITCEANASLSG